MFEAIQVILVVIGLMLISNGLWKIAKCYNIDKFLSMIIYKKLK